MPRKDGFDIDSVRSQLRGKQGREYWRSLDELAQTKEFQELVAREFPESAFDPANTVNRRRFLQLMAASIALAGAYGCGSGTEEKILPYIERPPNVVPGKPRFYATAMSVGGAAIGLLAESHMNRPTKLEGNELHPASLGATDSFSQASILTLYDPSRAQTVNYLGEITSWASFVTNIRSAMTRLETRRGAGLRILTDTVNSPTLAAQLAALIEQFPEARWHQYEPVNADNAYEGARLAFGRDVHAIYDFTRADTVLSLDADFLSCTPANLRYARDFTTRRNIASPVTGPAEMNRLYVVESTYTLTGGMADHRIPLRPSQIADFARLTAAGLGIGRAPAETFPEIPGAWMTALINDLQNYRSAQNPGGALVVPGDHQPAIVHAFAHAMNETLGAVGTTVRHTQPIEAQPENQIGSLRELVEDMNDGHVDLLVIMGANPAYTAPADIGFTEALANVRLRVAVDMFNTETTALCHWHIPQLHYLESWSDARAFDGTASIIQPLIAPLYGGRTAHDVVAALAGTPLTNPLEVVRDYWRTQYTGGDFEAFWATALHDGIVPGTEAAPVQVRVRRNFLAETSATAQSEPVGNGALEISFRPDPTVYDGRFATNAWLQELPKPFTKVTWDNPALVSPATAARYELRNEDLIVLTVNGRSVRAPVFVLPGQPDDCLTVHLGYGRTTPTAEYAGGFNAYNLRTTENLWFGGEVQIQKTGERYPLATTQHHHLMEGRDIVRAGTLAELLAHPEHPEFMHVHHAEGLETPSLYPEFEYDGYRWGMAINQSVCFGCNACVVACQAENNIPVVGKVEVMRGREMHWLRIDSYYEGDPANPISYHQPVPCMHCEKAPCEVVCPVAATVHSEDGLNDMVYNRCVGTRYCSNNCPYKVRRFNFFQYADLDTPSIKAMRNPDVSVRVRGVMEKCTYCVQRIRQSTIDAQVEGRPLRKDEFTTACASACPSQAIIFGDINHPESEVRRLKELSINYPLLGHLNTQPRTTYLAAVRNPNPNLTEEEVHG